MAKTSDSAASEAETVVTTPDSEPIQPRRYVLVMYHDPNFEPPLLGTVTGRLVATLRRELEDKITAPRELVEIDVWLESPGGDAHAAYKLAVLLRAAAHRIRVVVPDYAKSAATLLALCGDEIYMAPGAELGPLDAQIPNEGALVSTISALDIARSVEDLIQTTLKMALSGGAAILDMTRLSRAESLSTMLDFSAKFMEPVVRQLDPTMMHWSSTLLQVSAAYASRVLDMREASPTMSQSLPTSLVENYPTHGFVICRDEAREKLGLPVKDLTDYDLAKKAVEMHRLHEDTGTNMVSVLSVDDLVGIKGVDGGDGG